jgi:hypothetical protein
MQSVVTKESLLRQVDGLRDIARRSRRLSESMAAETDRDRLLRHSRELDDRASILERQAADAKTVQFSTEGSELALRRGTGG